MNSSGKSVFDMFTQTNELGFEDLITNYLVIQKTAIEHAQRGIGLIEEYRNTLITHAVTDKIDVRKEAQL